jgi:hypothetical protein
MAIAVIFDEGATPQGVLDVKRSINADDYLGRTDVLLNPDLSAVAGEPNDRYWKVVGALVVEMTQPEKDALDAADAAAVDLEIRTAAKGHMDNFEDLGLVLRAEADVIKDEINILRARWNQFTADVAAAGSLADLKVAVAAYPDLDPRTLVQLRASIKSRIDSKDAD